MRVLIALFSLVLMTAGCTVNQEEYTAGLDAALKAPTYEEAVQNYEKNVTKSVHSDYYYEGLADIDYAFGRYGEAVNNYTKAIRNHGDAKYHLKRGRAYVKLSFYKDAVIDFRTVIDKAGKKYPVAYVERAKAHVAMGDYAEAAKDLKGAERWGGESADFLVAMGDLLFNMGKYDEAKTYTLKAMQKSPENSDLYLLRAKVFYKQKDANQAVNDLEKAIKIDKTNLEAKRMLAWVYSTNPLESYRNGEKAVKIAKELYDLNVVHYAEVMAAAYAETDDFENAIKVLDEAIAQTQDLVQKEDFRYDIQNYEKGTKLRLW
ncbi:MAG: tetratricopeptide repeat protein [Deferribacterales bacterium]